MKKIIFLLCIILTFTACGIRKEENGVTESNKEKEYIVNCDDVQIKKLENVEKEKTVEFLGEEYQGSYSISELQPLHIDGVDGYTGEKDGRVIYFEVDRKSGELYRIMGLKDVWCEEVSTKTEEEYEMIARNIAKEYADITEWDMTLEMEEGEHPTRSYTFCKKYGDYLSANIIYIQLNENGEMFGIEVNLLEMGDDEIEAWVDQFDEKTADEKVINKMLTEKSKEVTIRGKIIVQNGESIAMCYSFEDITGSYCLVTME